MFPHDVADMLRKKPFEPFRIIATDGRTYDVRHPDQALVLLGRVILPSPTDKEFSERSEHLSLDQIVRFEELPAKSPSAPDGQSGNSNGS